MVRDWTHDEAWDHLALRTQCNKIGCAFLDSMRSEENNNANWNKLRNLNGYIVLITGADHGWGPMITQTLAIHRAEKVYITGQDDQKLDRIVEMYGKEIEGEIVALKGFESTEEGILKLVREIEGRQKFLDILINNAEMDGSVTHLEHALPTVTNPDFRKNGFGIVKKAECRRHRLRELQRAWLLKYESNVLGVYRTSVAFLPLLGKSTKMNCHWVGTILNITSTRGTVVPRQQQDADEISERYETILSREIDSEVERSGCDIRLNNVIPSGFVPAMTGKSDDHPGSHTLDMKHVIEVFTSDDWATRNMELGLFILFVINTNDLDGYSFEIGGRCTLPAGM